MTFSLNDTVFGRKVAHLPLCIKAEKEAVQAIELYNEAVQAKHEASCLTSELLRDETVHLFGEYVRHISIYLWEQKDQLDKKGFEGSWSREEARAFDQLERFFNE